VILWAKKTVKRFFHAFGYDIVPKRWSDTPAFKELGMEEDFYPLYLRCEQYTMTSIEKMHALYRAVNYLVVNHIPGDIVECGVAAGGSMMLASLTLLRAHVTDRKIYLYDTFKGMPKPTARDTNYRGDDAMDQWRSGNRHDYNEWCYFPLHQVREHMKSTGYPENQTVFVEGRVQDTIPYVSPARIALLRLDTDWYESTSHELRYLYPLLVSGGVLIIDDYGHWEGCRIAADEYFSSLETKPLLTRVDRLGVITIKVK
jgi:hypothetical protein